MRQAWQLSLQAALLESLTTSSRRARLSGLENRKLTELSGHPLDDSQREAIPAPKTACTGISLNLSTDYVHATLPEALLSPAKSPLTRHRWSRASRPPRQPRRNFHAKPEAAEHPRRDSSQIERCEFPEAPTRLWDGASTHGAQHVFCLLYRSLLIPRHTNILQ